MNNILEIKELICEAKTLWGQNTLINISQLNLQNGEILGLVGESGSGKSILAQSILKILPKNVRKTHGKIIFDGVDMDTVSNRTMEKQYRGKKMSMIFQDPMASLNPVFTVAEQIGAVIHEHNHSFTKQQIKEKALEMLKTVKLSDPEFTLNKYPHELSGGMRQRVLIATALCSGAQFLISDEATRALDVTIQAGILELLRNLRDSLGLSTLFISSNIALAASESQRIGILYEGTLVEIGTTEEILSNPVHPYTKMFLSCLPRPEYKGRPMFVPKNLSRTPKNYNGCKFVSNCPYASDKCFKEEPKGRYIGDSHFVSCCKEG